MARPIGFSAFLKLLELSSTPRKSELRKKLGGGGGFQYWRPIQTVAPKAIISGSDTEALKAEIDALSSGHQRKYNQNAFDTFSKWVLGKPFAPIETLPTLEIDFGNSGLTVKMRPDLSFALEGTDYSMTLWATTKPALSAETLSVGLLFMLRAYKAKGHVHRQHLIFDTVGNRIFREGDILPTAIHLLKDKVDAFKKDWDELNPPPTEPPETPKPDQPPAVKS